MATSKKIDKNKLKLPAKKGLVKPLADAKQAEIAVDLIHKDAVPLAQQPPADAPATAKPEKEKAVRYSIDIPQTMHRDLKMKCLTLGIDMKDYFLDYVKKDLYPEIPK